MQWKIGDMVICEFEICEIRGISGERVTEVSDGIFSHNSYDLSDRIFPLTLANKVCSEPFSRYKDKLLKEGLNCFNYPDFCDFFVQKWVLALQNPNESCKYINEMIGFVDAVLEEMQKMKKIQVQGVYLIHR
jgi:hypothetical protein